MTKSILFAGVGGQGILLSSKLLTAALIASGYDVKMSEVHGMAQRGGSVTTQVRFGEKVHSPIIGKGDADVLVAFEPMEAARWLDHLKPGGRIILNTGKIPSSVILSGDKDYPEGIEEYLAEHTDLLSIDAQAMAVELGNAKAMNVILLGALAKSLAFEDVDWTALIRSEVRPAFYELNEKAFQMGFDL